MNAKTYTTAVVIIPPESIWPPIQALRQQHDRNVRRWMPHITLLYPFRPREAFAGLIAPLSQACASLAPFDVTFSTVSVFQHGRSSATVWLAPEPVAPIIALQTALWRVVPDCDDTRRRDGFTPHLSVGQSRGQGAGAKLRNALQVDWEPLTFTVTEVCLISRGEPPDDVFRVDSSVRIGTRHTLE